MEKIVFKSGRYALRRLSDGAGDSGALLNSVDPDTGLPVGKNGEVIVGCRLKCGSACARSFMFQDWWMCTVITKIIERHDGYALVETETKKRYLVGEAEKVAKAWRDSIEVNAVVS